MESPINITAPKFHIYGIDLYFCDLFVKHQNKEYMLKKILSLAGKSGLFKMISNTPNALIVESFADGKRFPVPPTTKIISLNDISIYTEEEDMPLKQVFKRILEQEQGSQAIDHKASAEQIKAYFSKIVPEYDKERVYVSDMKKMLQWYNILNEKQLLHFDETESEETEKQ